jgi:hypothetical protein
VVGAILGAFLLVAAVMLLVRRKRHHAAVSYRLVPTADNEDGDMFGEGALVSTHPQE